MEQISDWRKSKNKISEHKIEIGSLNEQIGLLKEKIGEHKEEIATCENETRETGYYWVEQWVKNNLPDYHESFLDSVSQGQYESKLWLHNELKKINLNQFGPLHIDIVGSWFGYPLIESLSNIFDIKQIDLYDIDENCHKVVAQYINHFDPDFRIVQFDNFFDRKDVRRRHLIINTSSEHMPDIAEMKNFYKDYPERPLIVLQSNNFETLDEHVNCVQSPLELIDKNQLTQIHYKGKHSLPLYDRYMVIGRW